MFAGVIPKTIGIFRLDQVANLYMNGVRWWENVQDFVLDTSQKLWLLHMPNAGKDLSMQTAEFTAPDHWKVVDNGVTKIQANLAATGQDWFGHVWALTDKQSVINSSTHELGWINMRDFAFDRSGNLLVLTMDGQLQRFVFTSRNTGTWTTLKQNVQFAYDWQHPPHPLGKNSTYLYNTSQVWSDSKRPFFTSDVGFGAYGFGVMGDVAIPDAAIPRSNTDSDRSGIAGGCFAGDTSVFMEDKTLRRIDDLNVGDRVLAYDEITQQVAGRPISRVHVHRVAETMRLHFATGNEVTTTEAHRFFVPTRGFVPARSLESGVSIVSNRDAQGVEVNLIARLTCRAVVYNLTVEEYHTYFVGADGLLVHNMKEEGPPIEVGPDPE
jgi:hypothetical protein